MATRILIVRLGSLGDLVHTLPAAAAIRRAHPDAELDWIVDAPHRQLLELVPILTTIITLEGRDAGAWRRARARLRSRAYDVALDFQGLVKSAALARLSGARRVIGFDRAALRERWAGLFYTERAHVGERGHVIDKNMRLAASVGAADDSREFPVAQVDASRIGEFVAGDPRPFAIINPGAAWPNKRWPPDRFGAVAQHLLDRHELPSIVLWGPGEQPLAAQVVSASNGAARLAPPTDLHGLIALARRARLVISGDTGPLHLACAVGVPAVALFGPTNPDRNGPWDPSDVSLSRYRTCDCHYERRCLRPDATWCLGSIDVAHVTAAIDQRLSR